MPAGLGQGLGFPAGPLAEELCGSALPRPHGSCAEAGSTAWTLGYRPSPCCVRLVTLPLWASVSLFCGMGVRALPALPLPRGLLLLCD